jgi:hypothetical protein
MSGTFRSRSRGAGIAPSRSVPSTPAKAQNRSPTIATPSGLAMPPRRGRACRPSKLASTDSTNPTLPGLRPPGNGPGGLRYEKLRPTTCRARRSRAARARER